MFLGLPLHGHNTFQHLALILNTVLLIGMLIVLEVTYSEVPKDKRQSLRLFLPLVLTLIGLLIYAVYSQAKGA